MRQLKITKSITNRESQSLEKYLQEIGKTALLSEEEEVRLSRLICKGNQAALDRLVKANLRFVVSVAKQYQNQGLSLPDLINEGNLGVIKAAQRFDETKGFKFISYAVWWIRQSILQALAEQARMVRLPLNKVGLTNKINRAYTQLEQEFEREPTPEEIGELLGEDPENIAATLGIAARHTSIDMSLCDEEDYTLLDVLADSSMEHPDSELVVNDSFKKELDRSLGTLSTREKDVILLFFGIGIDQSLTLEEIGERFNLTRERIRQIKDKGIEKLRANPKTRRVLKQFF